MNIRVTQTDAATFTANASSTIDGNGVVKAMLASRATPVTMTRDALDLVVAAVATGTAWGRLTNAASDYVEDLFPPFGSNPNPPTTDFGRRLEIAGRYSVIATRGAMIGGGLLLVNKITKFTMPLMPLVAKDPEAREFLRKMTMGLFAASMFVSTH